MRLVLPLAAALLPVLIAPGILFYFDVTPKVVFLLITVAAALVLWRGEIPISDRGHRVLLALFAAQALSLVFSTLASTHRALSLYGGNWRRFGLAEQLAILLFAMLVAVDCASRRERVTAYLEAIVLGGIPVSIYTILQYFGWDPLLPKQSYHMGEFSWSIVRPPSTMGHASYLATYLLFVVFAAAELFRLRTWRAIAVAAAILGSAAIVLSGTRAALLGLLAGAVFAAWTMRLRPRRAHVAALAAIVCASAVFYWSPAGRSMRHRVTWISMEPLGGARPLLWRDSLRMSLGRFALGYGPETFITEFPRHESLDLARELPDFLHESPHNVFLDALLSQGVLGLAVLIGLCAWGVLAGRREPFLGAALVACIVAQLFTSFILPTAVFFFLALALLTASDGDAGAIPTLMWGRQSCLQPPFRRLPWRVFHPKRPAESRLRPIPLLRLAGFCTAALLALIAVRLFVSDQALASASAALDRGDLAHARIARQREVKWQLPGSSSDVYYSRRVADFARSSADLNLKAQAVRDAFAAAESAPRTSEETANAWYNLAAFMSLTNSAPDVERSLRQAIAAAPAWYKPHWILAQLLVTERRMDDARREAELAYARNGTAPEVRRTLENIRAVQGHTGQ